MAELTGCEAVGSHVAEEVATLSVDALTRFEPQYAQLVSQILNYLRQISPKWLNENEGKERTVYRDWVIHFFCTKLIEVEEVDAYEILSNAGWYRAGNLGIKQLLAREMIKESNFAFADWYRTNSSRVHEDYLDLVSRLAKSEHTSEREAAFYMIRHTRLSHGAIAVRVDPEFKPLLARLAADPELIRIQSAYRDFFRINVKASDVKN